jgi:hypothetical protein
MSQRTIYAGLQPNVTVHAGWDVVVKGWESDRVQVSGRGIFGLDLMRLGDEIEVSLGLSGEVLVPLGSHVKVYSGRGAKVSNLLQGSAAVVAGGSARITQVAMVDSSSTGLSLEIDADNLASDRAKFVCGRGLRFCIRQLTDATFWIADAGGPWQAVIGNGDAHIELGAGGDVVLVTECEVQPQPAYGALGRVERPE